MRMESDEFDFLAPAYVRGFLRTYARFLRVNEEPLIQEFDRKYGRGKADTSAITALDNRARSVPRQRRPLNSWAVAAVLAAVVLVGLAVVGVVSSPDEAGDPAADVAESDEDPSPEPESSPDEEAGESPTPTPTPTETEDEDLTFALEDGLEVQLVAKRARCWFEITADGVIETPGGITLEVGDESQTFTAEQDMEIVLGFAEGVDLIVNGQNLGAPGGPDFAVVSLPEDVKDLF